MNSIHLFSLLLIVVSAALIVWHVVSWKRANADRSLCQMERGFAWRQCRRRVQASGMIGVVGIGIAAHRLVPLNGIAILLYILALAVIAGWTMLLAVADVAATRIHFRQMLQQMTPDDHSGSNGGPPSSSRMPKRP